VVVEQSASSQPSELIWRRERGSRPRREVAGHIADAATAAKRRSATAAVGTGILDGTVKGRITGFRDGHKVSRDSAGQFVHFGEHHALGVIIQFEGALS